MSMGDTAERLVGYCCENNRIRPLRVAMGRHQESRIRHYLETLDAYLSR